MCFELDSDEELHANPFYFRNDGTVKAEINEYPLEDAATVHELFAAKKTTGKVVLVPSK